MPERTHTVIDSDRARLIAQYRHEEKQLHDAESRLAAERRFSVPGDGTGTKIDPLAQYGNKLTHQEFEAKLLPLLPSNVRIEDNPNDPAKLRWVYQIVKDPITGRTDRLYVKAYYKGVLPERSIMHYKTELRPVTGLYKGSRKETGGIILSRKDMPAMEKVAADNPAGYTFRPKDPDAIRPGWVKETDYGTEAIPGWRTVLLYLMAHKILTKTQVENVFGVDNTPEWQGHTGGAKVSTLW